MPKITLQPEGQGMRQSRGTGVHFLARGNDGKGFVRHCKHATVSSPVAKGAADVLAFDVPSNAIVERIAFKIATVYENGSGDTDTLVFSGFKIGAQTFTFDVDENGGNAGYEIHSGDGSGFGAESAGTILSFAVSDLALHSTALKAQGKLGACVPTSGDVTLTMTLGGGAAGNADDTAAVVEVLVDYVVPTF